MPAAFETVNATETAPSQESIAKKTWVADTEDTVPKHLREKIPARDPLLPEVRPHANKFSTQPVTESTFPALQQKVIHTADIDAKTDLRTKNAPPLEYEAYKSKYHNTVDPGLERMIEVGSEMRGLFGDKPGRFTSEVENPRALDPFPNEGPARPQWDRVPSFKPKSERVYDRLQ